MKKKTLVRGLLWIAVLLNIFITVLFFFGMDMPKWYIKIIFFLFAALSFGEMLFSPQDEDEYYE